MSAENKVPRKRGAEDESEPPIPKRRKPDDAKQVAEHYDAMPATARSTRAGSAILGLRNFNNWVKATLYQQYCKPGARVLDLCCGQGGDLAKMQHARIGSVVMVDHAKQSVIRALERYNEGIDRKKIDFVAQFVVADCHDGKVQGSFAKGAAFDLVSCQMALHYSFETEQRARGLLQNVVGRLKPGGCFIGTMPDCGVLRARRAASKDGAFGNSIYAVKFDENKDSTAVFGERYVFRLEESVRDCPEYLVPFDAFTKLAAEYKLTPVKQGCLNFDAFYRAHASTPDGKRLLRTLSLLKPDSRLALSDDEKSVADLYTTFVFQLDAATGSQSDGNAAAAGKPHKLNADEIVVSGRVA